MNIGPKRIILINSGKYQYSEVEIDAPVHLVGSNNSGKTTLISILQYLYIDNENNLTFSKDYSKTKKYYFKSEFSYILFECVASDGYKVVGVRGLGGLKGTHERFAYMGGYHKQDFFHENGSVKNGAEVKLSLSDRNYMALGASQLRGALTGSENTSGLNLDLLPIKNKDSYVKFRKMYHNLLNLANVGQKELKSSLVHICESGFRTKNGINLEDKYSAGYDQIRKHKVEIEDLKKITEYVRECRAFYSEMLEYRSDLVSGFNAIKEIFAATQKKNAEKKEDFQETIVDLGEEKQKQFSRKINEAKKVEKLLKDLGEIGGGIKRITNEEKVFSEYYPDIERVEIQGLKKQADDLEFQLRASKLESVVAIETRIEKNKKQRADYQKRLMNVEHSVANHLRKEFSDEEIGSYFSLHNHALLGLEVSENGVVVSDHGAITARIRRVLEAIKENRYSDDSITIPLAPDFAPNLAKYTDIETIKAEIGILEKEIDKDAKTLNAAKQQESLQHTLSGINREFKEKSILYDRYMVFTNEKLTLPGLLTQQKQKNGEKTKIQEKVTLLEEGIKEAEDKVRNFKRQIARITEKENSLIQQIHLLTRPSAEWEILENQVYDEEDLVELLKNHLLFTTEEKRLTETFDKNMTYIVSATYDKYTKDTDLETLELLEEELNSLDKKEETVNRMWDGLLTGLGTSMSYMLDDLDSVKSTVDKLNRDIAKVQISDLKSLKIIVEDKQELTGLMRSIARKSAQTNLFRTIGDKATIEPIATLQKHFLSKGLIEVSDLFSLSFKVKKIDDTTEIHTVLKDVESTGTTIVIKVLVNLLLLKGLFDPKKKISIPFYLDEVASLDNNNGKSIVNQAVKLGFIPILASPAPMVIVDKLYNLRGGSSGLYVDQRNLTNLKNRESDHASIRKAIGETAEGGDTASIGDIGEEL